MVIKTLILILMLSSLGIAQTTPNLGLNIPVDGQDNWSTSPNGGVNANWNTLDAQVAPRSLVTINETDLTKVSADISALTSGGLVSISPNATGTITGVITISNPNVTVRCLSKKSVFTRASSQTFHMFQVTSAGTGFTLDGCKIDMNGSTGVAVFFNSGTNNGQVLNNTIIGSNGSQGIQMNGLVTGLIQNNLITNGNIFGQGNTQNIRVVNNDISETSSASAIEFHSTTSVASS